MGKTFAQDCCAPTVYTPGCSNKFFSNRYLHCPHAIVAAERGVRSAIPPGPTKISSELYYTVARCQYSRRPPGKAQMLRTERCWLVFPAFPECHCYYYYYYYYYY